MSIAIKKVCFGCESDVQRRKQSEHPHKFWFKSRKGRELRIGRSGIGIFWGIGTPDINGN